MKKLIRYLSFIILAVFILDGYSTKNPDDLFQFKNSYIENNNAVGNMVNQLQAAELLSSFELETKKQAYSIILNYDWSSTEGNY